MKEREQMKRMESAVFLREEEAHGGERGEGEEEDASCESRDYVTCSSLQMHFVKL